MYATPMENSMRTFSDDSVSKYRGAVEKYDKRLLAWLAKMHKMLTKDEFEEGELSDALMLLEHIKKSQDRKYVRDLIYPEDAKDAKIPTVFPVPSSSFQLHASFLVSTNASGNVAGYVNPLWLGNAALSTFYINNDVTLTGSGVSNFFTSVNANQNIPNSIYQRFRLVSYSLHVTYIGRWDIVSGIIGGGVTFDSGIGAATAVGTIEGTGQRYGNFDLVDDSYYAYRSNAINGLRIIYVPVDPSFEEYQNTNTILPGEQLHFYAQGLPVSATSLRIDTYANFECLADAEFQNFIPTTCASPAPEQVKQGVKLLTQNKDLVVTSKKEYTERKPSILNEIWSGVKNFYSNIYGVGKELGKAILPALIPGGGALQKMLPQLGGSDTSGLMDVD